jgi:uncharacterized protein GlcG (DUF336 family)
MDEQADRNAVSRRQALGYGGALVAGAAAGSLINVGPAAAAPSGGSVPSPSVSLARAERAIEAGIRFARSHNFPPMFLFVVDEGGDEKASQRMDGNSPASVVLVPVKARTAAAFRTSTATLARNTTDPARIASITTAGFSLLPGGEPLTDNGVVIGAVGAGGGSPDQDAQVAQAAARA